MFCSFIAYSSEDDILSKIKSRAHVKVRPLSYQERYKLHDMIVQMDSVYVQGIIEILKQDMAQLLNVL